MSEIASDIIRQTLDEAKAFVSSPVPPKISEADTKAYFIEPIIGAIGWRGIGVVNREYRVKNSGEFIDYVMLESGQPVLAIEAKPIQTVLSNKESAQLVQYCVIEGIKWAALTNGRELQFFNTFLTPNLDAKRVLTIDLLSYGDDEEFNSVLQQIALLSRKSIVSPDGAEKWLRRRPMDQRLRDLLLDGNSSTTRAMRKALDEVGIKATSIEVTDWVRSKLLQEPTADPKLKLQQIDSTHRDSSTSSGGDSDAREDEFDTIFDPASSSVLKGREDLVTVFETLMESVNTVAPETQWRVKRRYIAAADGDANTFLAILRSGDRLVLGLTLPVEMEHDRLRDKTWEFNWPRMTKVVDLESPQDVDESVLELIREAIASAPSFRGGSKRFYGATLRDLLNAGLIDSSERLVLMKGSEKVTEGNLTPNAQIAWEGRLYAVPSDRDFAKQIGRKSLNGWAHWHVERSNMMIPLTVLRDQLKTSSQ